MVQFVYLNAPFPLLICDTRELIATPIYRQRAYEKKQCLLRNLVLLSSLSLEVWRRQGAYLYMDCTARESLVTNFLVASTPLKLYLYKHCAPGGRL